MHIYMICLGLISDYITFTLHGKMSESISDYITFTLQEHIFGTNCVVVLSNMVTVQSVALADHGSGKDRARTVRLVIAAFRRGLERPANHRTWC